MLTPGERKALIFLAVLFLTGGAVRMVRAIQTEKPLTPAAAVDSADLAAQLAAVEARRAQGVGRSAPAGARTMGGAVGTTVPDSTPPRSSRRGGGAPTLRTARVPRVRTLREGAGPAPPVVSAGPLDVDQATEAELERLPRVGPSLARRIVEDRAAHGAFGSLVGLGRVKGIGPGMQRLLAPVVTFSGVVRMR